MTGEIIVHEGEHYETIAANMLAGAHLQRRVIIDLGYPGRIGGTLGEIEHGGAFHGGIVRLTVKGDWGFAVVKVPERAEVWISS